MLCDDQMAIRNHLRKTLSQATGWEVIGEASGGRAGVQMAIKLRPDVIIMDISMPDLNGIQATKRILSEVPETKVLIFSAESNTEIVQQAFSAGALGFLLKSNDRVELILALSHVTQGKRYVSAALSEVSSPKTRASIESGSKRPAPSDNPPQVRVLLVDDSTCVRERLAESLSALDGVEVIGQVGNVAAALEFMQKQKPEVVVVDIELPGQSGMELLADLPKTGRPLVIILTNYDYPVLRQGCARLGADFYFYKPVELERVIEVCEDLAKRNRNLSRL